jgi:phospholipid/cholesterol/gamma-HCH transport system substrate-binding protein
LFIGIIVWVRGLSLGNRSYKVIFDFATTNGLQTGAAVRYRGVKIGKVSQIRPGPNLVEVEAEISPADVIIPRDVVVQANPSGFIGETTIDITPIKQVDANITTKALDAGCDRAQIVCDNDHLPGQVGVSVDDVLKAAIRFTNLYSDPKLIGNINTVVKNAGEAAAEAAKLSREFQSLAIAVKQQVNGFGTTTQSIQQAAEQAGLVAVQVNELLAANRTNTITTLDNISQLTADLRSSVTRLSPTVDQISRSNLLRNLETLAANANEASTNLRDASRSLNNPANTMVLQQTLDSARATFQNAQKITADLDELTGDPAFRNSLRKLVNGLSTLVSSTQQLEQQTQFAQSLSELSTIAATQNLPPVEPPVLPPQSKDDRSPAATPTPKISPKLE